MNGSTSGPKDAVSGVPQGSVLGPILFLLFINDLPRVLSGAVLMFADDVKLISPRSESVVLQSDIHAIHSWTKEWDLPLNENKCSIISVGQSPAYPYTLYPGGPAIINAETTKDLGVQVDRSFKPSRHCVLAAQRARAALFLIVRTFVRLTPKIFTTLYCLLGAELSLHSPRPSLDRDKWLGWRTRGEGAPASSIMW